MYTEEQLIQMTVLQKNSGITIISFLHMIGHMIYSTGYIEQELKVACV